MHSTLGSALLAVRDARSGCFVLRWFDLNIDGDRIARWKCVFQRLIEQFVQMCHRGWMRFAQIFWDKHDIAPSLLSFVLHLPSQTLFASNEPSTQRA